MEVLIKQAATYINSILKAFPSLKLVSFYTIRFYINHSLYLQLKKFLFALSLGDAMYFSQICTSLLRRVEGNITNLANL